MMRVDFSVFTKFFKSSSVGGIILLICVGCSLVIANSALGDDYELLLNRKVGIDTDEIHLSYAILSWINDGLMAIFFLLVGLEIKRELIEGELSNFKKAALPVFAAFGGAIIPAIIFFLFNRNTETSGGWGIPMATDIAFALGILSLLGTKAPASLKIFLATLAIADDLIAILVIAVFYSSAIDLTMLLYSGIIFLGMLAMNRLNIKALIFYIIPAIFLWYFIHHSGIHATIAGVLTATAIPAGKQATHSPLEKLEHMLTYPVNFLIMPLFALANTNIRIEEQMTANLSSSLGLGIMFGLFVGKPIGITLMSWIIVRLGWGALPQNASWLHIIGLGLLGGIGFTMAIFIALLSFNDATIQGESKFAILIASTVSGICGFVLLRLANVRIRRRF